MSNKGKVSDFFTSLLGVILGIIFTFGVSALWQKLEEKKKTREMLILVRHELEANKKWAQGQRETLKQDSYAFKKLLEANKKWSSIPEDSLEFYVNCVFNYELQLLTTAAWEIFHNSDIIQKIPNKGLVIRLTDCYSAINQSYELVMNLYWDKKIKEIPYETTLYALLDVVMKDKNSLFYLQTMSESLHKNLLPSIESIIDYSLMLLDEFGDFRYDMDEEYKTFRSFMEARMDSIRNQ